MQNSEKEIKALILAAGYGTRLKPITEKTPKCLVKVGGIPILERWLVNLEQSGCRQAFINTHYLAEQVNTYLDKRKDGRMEIVRLYEEELKGTAGTLRGIKEELKSSINLLIHADNATKLSLKDLIQGHTMRPKLAILTMLTFETNDPKSCGIVELDKNRIVVNFHEKVSAPPGREANGAIYVFESEFIRAFEKLEETAKDFSVDVLPNLLGRIYSYHTNEKFIDIGSPKALELAQRIWEE